MLLQSDIFVLSLVQAKGNRGKVMLALAKGSDTERRSR